MYILDLYRHNTYATYVGNKIRYFFNFNKSLHREIDFILFYTQMNKWTYMLQQQPSINEKVTKVKMTIPKSNLQYTLWFKKSLGPLIIVAVIK